MTATAPMTLRVLFDRQFRRIEAEVPSVAAHIRAAIADRLPAHADT